MVVEGVYLGYKVVMLKSGKEKAIFDVYGDCGLVRIMGDVSLFQSFARGDKVRLQVETNNLVFASSAPVGVK